MNQDDLPNEIFSSLRKHAEEILASKQSKAQEIPSGDVLALIHELQVHQIELEMQNDELRAAQETIENSRNRFSDLYDYSPVGYLTIDKKGILLEANLTASELLRVERIHLVGKPLTAFVKREDQDILYLHLRSLREEFHTCELRLIRKNGTDFFAQLVSVPFKGECTTTKDILIAVFDISIRKSEEETHARIAAIVDGTDDAIISKTLDGIIVSWNGGAEKIYGYTEHEVKGKPISILAPLDLQTEILKILAKVKNGELVHKETIRKAKDGSLIPVSLTVSPVRTKDGTIIGASAIARDITDRKKWEQSILDLNERLQISNRELESLGHTLSHDLRGPLQGIIAYTKILLEEYAAKLDNECNRSLNQIKNNACEMDQMIRILLDMSRIARVEIRHEKFNLSEQVRSIINDCREADPLREVQVVIREDLHVEADKKLLHIAIDNLIRNSWKFTKHKSPAHIEFGIKEHQGATIFFLRDNGVGFNIKYAEKMFTIFQRLHSDSEFEGTGIGLATVRRIILRHGGKIWAQGEVDKGATFFFTLFSSV